MTWPQVFAELGRDLLTRWHKKINERHMTLDFHLQSVEFAKTYERNGYLKHIDKASSDLFIVSCAVFQGYDVGAVPPMNSLWWLLVYLNMFNYYTSNWTFYRIAAFLYGFSKPLPRRTVCETLVIRDETIGAVALLNGMDPERFANTCKPLLKIWAFIPSPLVWLIFFFTK